MPLEDRVGPGHPGKPGWLVSPPPVPPAPSTPTPSTSTPSTPSTSSTPSSGADTPRGTRRSRAAVVLGVTLAVTLVAAGAIGAYLWRTTDAWHASSDDWRALATRTASDLASAQADLRGARTELDETRDQLTTAQDRITALADEKAQLGDDSAAQQQLADYQARVSQAAGQVATALATCIDGQQQLIAYLADAASYDQEDIERFGDDVDALCAQATAANEALQRELEP